MSEVLVVDDDPTLRDLMRDILLASGIDSTGASNGHEALVMMASKEFSLVITDISMPGMGGIALAARIKTRHKGIPVIAVTGVPAQAAAAIGLFDDVLAKPVTIGRLETAVKKYLGSGTREMAAV